jgi:hypothetical protein
MFARRTVDLNAVCFTLDGARFDGTATDADGWKELSQTYAHRTIAALGTTGDAHDAGYDSLVHLHAWRFLRSVSQGEPTGTSREVQPPRLHEWRKAPRRPKKRKLAAAWLSHLLLAWPASL